MKRAITLVESLKVRSVPSILTSEWCGMTKRHGVLHPKSFSSLSPQDRADAYTGLLYLITSTGKESNLFRTLEQVPISKRNNAFFELIVIQALQNIEKALRTFSFNRYHQTEENAAKIKGRIDFIKSERQNMGLKNKLTVKYNQLSYQHELLSFCRRGCQFASLRLQAIVSKPIQNELQITAQSIQFLLADCNELVDDLMVAMKTIRGSYDREPAFLVLLPDLKIISHFFLSQYACYEDPGSSSNLGTPGFLMNLNRTLEQLLRFSLELQGGFTPISGPINHIVDKVTGKQAFRMIPDCKGTFKPDGDTAYNILLDAKHKIMAKTPIDDDDILSVDKINRSDFYQIVSYAQTNKHNLMRNNRFGLVGLVEEGPGGKDEMVFNLGRIEIEYGPKHSLTIHRIAVAFGTILGKIGRLAKNHERKEIDRVLADLGKEILSVLAP